MNQNQRADYVVMTNLCAHRLHEWCADVPPSLTGCKCPCHTGTEIGTWHEQYDGEADA